MRPSTPTMHARCLSVLERLFTKPYAGNTVGANRRARARPKRVEWHHRESLAAPPSRRGGKSENLFARFPRITSIPGRSTFRLHVVLLLVLCLAPFAVGVRCAALISVLCIDICTHIWNMSRYNGEVGYVVQSS